jgi:hypothetical protein
LIAYMSLKPSASKMGSNEDTNKLFLFDLIKDKALDKPTQYPQEMSELAGIQIRKSTHEPAGRPF